MYFSDAGISSIMLDSDIEKQVPLRLTAGCGIFLALPLIFSKECSNTCPSLSSAVCLAAATRSARCVSVSASTGVQLVVADANHCARAQHVETTGQIYATSYC